MFDSATAARTVTASSGNMVLRVCFGHCFPISDAEVSFMHAFKMFSCINLCSDPTLRNHLRCQGVIRHLKQEDAFSRTWWSASSIDKLVTWQHLSIERIGGHVMLKASSYLMSLLTGVSICLRLQKRHRSAILSCRCSFLSIFSN